MMYNILDYGAQLNTGKVCTAEIQAAIDACAANGGGRVVIPAGTFVTGSIFLKNHIELHLESGAVLKASDNLSDYNSDDAYEQNYGFPPEGWNPKHLIICVECNDVALTGFGTINGSGDVFYNETPCPPWHAAEYAWVGGYRLSKDMENFRPGQLCCFIECTNVRVENITVTNATCWACFLHGCEEVQVRGLKVYNPSSYFNTDGIDIDCCRNVTVSDCHISTGDDAITLRCDQGHLKNPKPCENITITNCCLESNSSAFRFGVGTGTIRHAVISNIVVSKAGTLFTFNTSYGGGGCAIIDDLRINNVTAYNTGMFIDANLTVGSVTRCAFRNIRVSAKGAILLKAKEDAKLEDIVIENTDLTVVSNERKMWEKYIVEMENNSDVRLENFRVFADTDSWEGAYSAKNCEGTVLRNCVFPE